MARRKESAPGLGRLLDAWVPPSDGGPAIGCLVTSYTFDSVFFEEECLARFAGIRSGALGDDRGLEWLVEREEKFSQIKALALVDKDHCHGPRSPRWDLLCARGGGRNGIMHAKISLLVWTKRARLIIASANLTPSGYRQNREIFSVLDIAEGIPLANQAINDGLEYLENLLPLAGPEDFAPCGRAQEVIALARERMKSLKGKSPEPEYQVRFHGIGQGRPTLFEDLKKDWESASGAVRKLYVVSPFFDPTPSAAKGTAVELWALGAERGELELALSAPMEQEPSGRKFLQAPEEFGKLPRAAAKIIPYGVLAIDPIAKERRPLHAKLIGMENENWVLMATGSSNMTQAGTGLSKRPNWEAMVSFLVRREGPTYKAAEAALEAVVGLKIEDAFDWQGTAIDLEDEGVKMANLPPAFGYALYRSKERVAEIEITFISSQSLPSDWKLFTPENEPFAGEADWIKANKPPKWVIPWNKTAPPSELLIKWPEAPEGAWLPICVESPKDLPPPDVLRGLPLELLIEVLTTARPLAQMVAAYLKNKISTSSGPSVELDPHKRVDVSSYLIPRTRRVSKAFRALREKLEEPCASMESLNWRLRGPFGAKAILEAISREAKSPEENSFFDTEFCLEMNELKPKPLEGGLSPKLIKEVVSAFIKDQADAIESGMKEIGPSLKTYIGDALAKVRGQG